MSLLPTWWPTATPETEQPAPAGNLWVSLQDALDVKQAKPEQADGIFSKEMTDGSGHHFMLRNSRTHTYARLAPEEFWIWEHMDGARTVQQIVLAYFMEFKSFAFGAAVNLIGRLSAANMLSEPPRHLYAGITQELEERSWSHKLTWLARTAFTKEWVIKGLDGHLDRIHRSGGWILFSLPVQISLVLVSAIGTFLFLGMAPDPRYHLLGDGLDAAFLAVGLLSYIPLVIHEFAHAITAKHFGCEVHKGGVMLYYGLPAAFVDTTDVWMQGKRARLAVTWAGPYTGYIIAGVCTLTVYFLPDLPISTATLLLQLSLVSIFVSTLNLLPILKLDGYYLLADALEIPRLRERSIDFIFKELRSKLAKREAWSRDERIFLIFGMLALLSTIYFTYAALTFWDSKTSSSISKLFSFNGDYLAQAMDVLTVLLAVSSIAYSIYLLARNATELVQWLRKVGLLSTSGRAALVIACGALGLAILPQIILPTLAEWFILGGGVLAFGAAAWLAFSDYRRMRGSIHAGMWLCAACGLALGAVSFAAAAILNPARVGLGLNAAGLAVAVLMFVFAGRLPRGLRGSWRAVSLSLTTIGIAAWAAAIVVNLYASMVTLQTWAGLLILGGLLHWDMRPATLDETAERKPEAKSTRGQIVHAFNQIKLTILGELEKDFGRGTLEAVQSGFYASARSRVAAGSVQAVEFNSTQTGLMPNDYGATMALSLEQLLVGVEKAAGTSYAVRALAYGYDSLDWELQELAEDYTLKYVTSARGLSQELAGMRNDVEALVRSVPIFATLQDDEIATLCKQLKSVRFGREEVIIKQGDVGDVFYLIRAGRVEVLTKFDPKQKYASAAARNHVMFISLKEKSVAQLTRGDFFGELALLSEEKRKATVRALTAVELLYLERNEFNRLLRRNFAELGSAQITIKRLGILRQIPLFAEFQGRELSLLERKLQPIEIPAGETVFKHGESGKYFYIIESGKVSVQLPVTNDKGDVSYVERAALGSGEYFGELSLLVDAPRSATVIATKPTTLLRMDAQSFADMLNQSEDTKQAFQRASSRRVLSNERFLREEAASGG